MSMIVEKLLAHDHCSDIFQLPTGKCKGHDADENIFQLLVGKCGGGYTGRDKPIAEFFDRYRDKVDCFLGAAETLVRQSIDEYLKDGRDHLQVAFGCTGNAPAAKRSGCLSAKREPQRGRKGPRQHRSVYFAERMAERLVGTDGVEIELIHVARPYWKKVCSNETDYVNQRGEMK